MGNVRETIFVQALVPKLPIEALDEAVLDRFRYYAMREQHRDSFENP
jgi:hypothetical protein